MGQLKTNYSIKEDAARQFADRVYVLLLTGQFEAARIVIDEAELTKQDLPNAALKDMPIAQLDLEDKIINLFEKMGYMTVGNLIGVTEHHLLKTVPMCGENTIKALKKSLLDEMTKRRNKDS